MDIIQEAKEELSTMKSAIETLGYLHIDEEKAGKLIDLISRLVDRLEWQDEMLKGMALANIDSEVRLMKAFPPVGDK